MKKVLTGLAFVAALAMTGCGSGASSGGRPSGTDGKGDGKEAFTFNQFKTHVSIKQGETKSEKISISRGDKFNDDVTLTFDDDKKGLTLKPSSAVIKGSDKEITVEITADDKADIDKHEVTVHGKPSKGGESGTLKFTVDVSKK